MNYQEYTQRAYEMAKLNGFHDKELPQRHWMMLVITEVAEMVNADQIGHRAQVAMFKRESVSPQPADRERAHWKFCFETFIKDSVEDEMADVCIRLFDFAGNMGLIPNENPLQIDNDLLPRFRKKSFTEKAFELCRHLTHANDIDTADIELILAYMEHWAKSEYIDLEWHINQKMQYNAMRPRLHGKRY